jgi:hypothetical protein
VCVSLDGFKAKVWRRKLLMRGLCVLTVCACCVVQVASNFNGVEAISEGSSPDGASFTEKYIYDPTQGPAASISAGPGA